MRYSIYPGPFDVTFHPHLVFLEGAIVQAWNGPSHLQLKKNINIYKSNFVYINCLNNGSNIIKPWAELVHDGRDRAWIESHVMAVVCTLCMASAVRRQPKPLSITKKNGAEIEWLGTKYTQWSSKNVSEWFGTPKIPHVVVPKNDFLELTVSLKQQKYHLAVLM